ncbi:SO2930 family diheme c-type cytochrome [Algoriphagus sp. oki45]|uniref:SO2930 family diheme c-type cytochrome n=1 Tax=Algoriphagus sp. oki45 TaxID=3067294 RepID=UPI0030C770E3
MIRKSSRNNWVLGLILGLVISCQGKNENSITETSQAKSGERALAPEEADGNYPYRRLSTYGFFEGEMNKLEPASTLTLYRPASSLFTDYAWKSRFVYFPDGSQAKIVGDEMDLPLGSILIKNFYYPNDFRKPEEGKRIIETRLMIHEEGGWQAYPYLWNEEQTDAVLKVVGAQLEVKFTDSSGKDQIINYLVPNKNQCKSCHNKDEKLAPIGIQPKHLNHELDYGGFKSNQLAYWAQQGHLSGFEGVDAYPKVIDYEDQTQALDDRAMAYLDINCSHCHRAEGPASTSGLFLTYDQKDPLKLGVNKTPVAAGKGAGSFTYDIHPGKADQSILTYRMNSTEVGVAMPEIGRTTVHEEGVELIRQWINSMPESK